MNKIILVILFFCFPALAAVTQEPCVRIYSSVDIGMYRAMIRDLKIAEEEVVRDKTEMTLLKAIPVNKKTAFYFAMQDFREIKHSSLDALVSDYSNSGAKILTVQYVYKNRSGKRNTFIGTSIVNRDECSIRFNGYLLISREF